MGRFGALDKSDWDTLLAARALICQTCSRPAIWAAVHSRQAHAVAVGQKETPKILLQCERRPGKQATTLLRPFDGKPRFERDTMHLF